MNSNTQTNSTPSLALSTGDYSHFDGSLPLLTLTDYKNMARGDDMMFDIDLHFYQITDDSDICDFEQDIDNSLIQHEFDEEWFYVLLVKTKLALEFGITERILVPTTNKFRKFLLDEGHLDKIDQCTDWLDVLLLLSGDIESNPGPNQSKHERNEKYDRPTTSRARNNEPRVEKLEKVVQEQQDKITKLLKEIRKLSGNKKIRPQMFGMKKIDDFNKNVSQIADILEKVLPVVQTNLSNSLEAFSSTFTAIKDDVMKIVVMSLLITLLCKLKQHRAAIGTLLLFVAYQWKLPSTIIAMIKELKNDKGIVAQIDAEEFIYQPAFAMCGKLIFAVMAFVAIGFIPGKHDCDAYMLRLDRIPRAIEGGKKIVDYITDYWNMAYDQLKMLVLGKTKDELHKANGVYLDIETWAKEVRKYMELDERNKIDVSLEVANHVEKLYLCGLNYLSDRTLDVKTTRMVQMLMGPAKSLYEYISCSPVKGGGPRMRPVCVWLIGESGVGKTEMVYPLCIDLLRTMGLTSAADYHHQVYARQVETEYWDGYKNQKIVIYDDAFQLKDDKTSPNPEIFEVIRSCNTFPQHLHMAALHDKNTFSSAEVLLYTTNNADVQVESLTFKEAFLNRMYGHAYTVRPKLEYAIQTSDAGGNIKRTLDYSKLNPDIPIDLSIYEFQKVEMNKNDDGPKTIDVGTPLSYIELQRLLCNEWKLKKEASRNKLRWLENYANKPITVQMDEDDFFDCESEPTEKEIEQFLTNGFIKGRSLIEMEAELAYKDKYEQYFNYKRKNVTSITQWTKYKGTFNAVFSEWQDQLSKWQDQAKQIIRDHPFLSTLGIVGSILAVAGACMMLIEPFMDEKTRIVPEMHVSGDSKTARKTVKKVEMHVSGDSKTAKKTVKHVEMTTSGDSKTKKLSQKRVEMLPQITEEAPELLEQCVKAQGCSDETGHLLTVDILRKNTYRLSYVVDGIRKQIGNVTFLKGFVAVMPYHFIMGMVARGLNGDSIIYLSNSEASNIIQFKLKHLIDLDDGEFSLTKHCVQLTLNSGATQDCVVMCLAKNMCHPHRDITKHIVYKKDQGLLSGKTFGAYATFHVNKVNEEVTLHRAYQWLANIRPLDYSIEISMPDDGHKYGVDSYQQRECYTYNAPTQNGDCGSLIGVYNNRMTRKIIGMHIAGDNDNAGYAIPLNFERLESVMTSMAIYCQFYYEPDTLIQTQFRPTTPDGSFAPIGKAKKSIGQATNTAILPSLIHGKITAPTTKPALLKPTKVNDVVVDPLMNGLKKCGVTPALIDQADIDTVSMDLKAILNTKYNESVDISDYRRVLTYEEAIMGANDDFMVAVNRTTSPGFPYTLEKGNKPGKTKWMGEKDNFDFTSPDALKLRQDVDQLIDDCANGKITNVYCVDTLKDERRPIEKVDAGKTRVFSACPQHFVVAFRKYFLGFSAWTMHNRIDNGICVGTNVYSNDWHRLTMRLKAKGIDIIAGDFTNFDGSLNAQLMWAILDIIQDFYDDGPENAKIRMGLWMHIMYSVHIFGDNVYMWTHSQPSGNPFTSIINSIYNLLVLRLAWIIIMTPHGKGSMYFFNLYVNMVAYGDDNALNISKAVIHLFNQITIAEALASIKHTYTDEGKTGEIVESRKLSDIKFLKRGFVFNKIIQRYVAPLDKDVIYEMLNWTRNTIDPTEILISNIETAAREISLHGQAEYDEFIQRIRTVRDYLPTQPKLTTYENYILDFKINENSWLEF